MTRSTSKGVALVTGAANGIGKGIALRLAADGFDVPVNDVESNLAELEALARELRSVGRRTATVVADVSNGPFAFTHSRRHYRFESARRLSEFDIRQVGLVSVSGLVNVKTTNTCSA